ncbi:hypothetical protein D6D85_07295 [Candidatus Methanodesulfokora washburnensis]|uniref:Membrane protein 6-pyruvoyl-tetrahydropterin synthase-related domain-containing protein n=1 Tax=Candidatus Methanodesulfokora washburnensis TaxID=2478471 RepID=A0A429GMC4_9CREN|nr:hypothetical protein D6D85_07295 [Candidatus Methanodesulfokores washburnensis]
MSLNSIKLKQGFLDIFLGVAISVLVTFALLIPIILSSGIPFYGDETYYYINFKSFYFNLFNQLFWWVSARGSVPPLTIFSYSIPLALLVGLLGQELAVKIFILAVASLPGVSAYFALKILAKEWSLFNDEGKARLFALSGALFMLFSFTNCGLIGAGTAPAWALIMLPISFAFLVKYLRSSSIKHLLLLGLCSLFAIANPFWIYLIVIMGLLYLVVEIAFAYHDRLIFFKRSIVVTLTIFALNAFWLVPTAIGYLLGAGGFFQIYTKEQLISIGNLRFLSHWNLLDVLMVGEHSYYFFWLHPQNYGPLNAIIPALAAASILIFRKNKYVLLMTLTLVIGIFLTKGIWEPGGCLYYLIANNLPYGAGAILRNPPKFMPLVVFSYAFLIGLIIAKFYEELSSLSIKRYHSLYSCSKLIITGGIILLVLSPITYGTILDLQGYTWPRYKPTYIPSVYDNINDWLSKQEGDFKVMWIPCGGAYIWKPYIITAFPDLYSSKPAVSFTKIYPEPLKSTDNIGKLLKVLGVRYVLYHGDSLDYPNEEILQNLLRQKDLKVIYKLNYTYIYENASEKTVPFIIFENKEYKGPIYLDFPAENSLNSLNALNLSEKEIRTAHILSYRQVSPVEWEVDVNASAPFLIVFTEPYDRLWRAYIGNEEVKSVSFDTVNSFVIAKTGIIHIRIYYILQTYYTLGLLISLVSFIFLTFLWIYRARHSSFTLP